MNGHKEQPHYGLKQLGYSPRRVAMTRRKRLNVRAIVSDSLGALLVVAMLLAASMEEPVPDRGAGEASTASQQVASGETHQLLAR